MTAIDVHCEISGPDDAPVLVLSNSLGSTTAMWDPQVPILAERLRVVRYDHRGHGGSPVPSGPYDLADLGADALRLLDRLGVEHVHWCGLSLGGMVGMWMAINAPQRIEREPAATAAVHAMLAATPDEGYASCCAAIEHMDLVPELGAIRAPTLVIAGRQDPATPPEHGERIAAGIPGARLELVDAAHLATIEQPKVVAELIAGHLLT